MPPAVRFGLQHLEFLAGDGAFTKQFLGSRDLFSRVGIGGLPEFSHIDPEQLLAAQIA